MEPMQSTARDANTADTALRPRILVADDSRVSRLSILKVLGTDFDVVQAENGMVAWDQIRQDSGIQAVLTDIQMPQMDGYELICRIRADENARVRDLPVIAITGTDDDAIRQQAVACGATDFITKPFDALQLRARIQAYARYDQTTRALTERSQSLEEQAITDPQTGLRSRRYLVQRGEQDIAYAKRHNQHLSLLRIDIDGFKKIYREHGDELGDQLIAWVAKLLYSVARTEDTVARVSGVEFAILASNTSVAEARRLGERIQAAVAAQPFPLGSVSIPTTVTIGLAGLKEDYCDTIEALQRTAHQRLCRASSEGGNRICASVMDEQATPVEEVTLTPLPDLLPDVPVTVESANADPELLSLLLPVEPELAAAATEMPSAERVGAAPADVEVDGAQPVTANVPAELVSVDKALALIARGRGASLLPYLETLMAEIRPLIELCERARTADKQ